MKIVKLSRAASGIDVFNDNQLLTYWIDDLIPDGAMLAKVVDREKRFKHHISQSDILIIDNDDRGSRSHPAWQSLPRGTRLVAVYSRKTETLVKINIGLSESRIRGILFAHGVDVPAKLDAA